MSKWRCSKRNCTFIGDGEPGVFLGWFYCPEHHPENNWIVIGYERYRAGSPIFEVHTGGRPVKEVQDSIAEFAGANPHIIYTVVKESDYRRAAWESIAWLFGGK